MPELIDRREAINRIELRKQYTKEPFSVHDKTLYDHCIADIEMLPAIEAEPVRHGRWIDVHFVSGDDFNRCSECGCYIEKTYFANDYNVQYCPNCGADMRDGGADNG